LGYFFFNEKITINQIIGSGISFFGILFLISQSFNQQDIFGKPLGNLILLVAVFFWASYFAISKKIADDYSQISISFVNFLVSAVLLSLLVPFELSTRPFSLFNISTIGLISLVIVGLFSSIIYINLIQVGIKKTGAFVASLFTYLVPLFAALTAVPILGEKITINLILGGILIIFGVFYATSYTGLLKLIKKSYN